MNPVHRYAVRCPAFRFYVDCLMYHWNHQPLCNILVLVGNINPVWVYPIAARFVPAAVLLLAVVNTELVHDHIGAWHDRVFAKQFARLAALLLCGVGACGISAANAVGTAVAMIAAAPNAQRNRFFMVVHSFMIGKLSCL